MMPSKITVPLIMGIAGTIGFNLSPIVFGDGMAMNVCFILYAGVVFALSYADPRVLGYATVLSACNPANAQANLSFSFLLAVLTIVKGAPAMGRVMWVLGKHRWWWLFLGAFLLTGLSVPFWPADLRAMITEVKQALGRLGYLAVLPLAVGLTIRTPRDGVRAVSLLCLMSVAVLVAFYFLGQAGSEVISAVAGGESIGVRQSIGAVSLNFVRTQVCIVLAALATVALALGVGVGVNRRALPFLLASGLSVLMIMRLASIGSALSMVCGMAVLAFCYVGVRRSSGRVLLGVLLLAVVGSALYWVVIRSENALAYRVAEKALQFETGGIDRRVFWEEGIAAIGKAPLGEGWSTRTGHSDWLLFLLAYGWPTGLLYVAAAGSLFMSLWRALRRSMAAADRQLNVLLPVGLAALSVYSANAILDMLSANIGYYETVWALILTPAAVMAVTTGRPSSRRPMPGLASPNVFGTRSGRTSS